MMRATIPDFDPILQKSVFGQRTLALTFAF